jgi:hypothetical protein
MPAVLRFGRYTVYIYAEDTDRHHLPHCHVRWADGSAVVALTGMLVLAGNLPRATRTVLREHAAELVTEWNRLNPQRPME